MGRAIQAGVTYFLTVFAIGFALGTIRVLLVIPRIGETNAVLLELPLMLALSWLVCGWLVRHFVVTQAIPQRLAMGAIAFALLLLAELAVSVLGLGRTPAEHLASYQALGAQLGLAAQILFALMPAAHAALRC